MTEAQAADKEFVEHLLDEIGAVLRPADCEIPPDSKIRWAYQWLVYAAKRRPDAVVKRPWLWDCAKDLINGLRSGHVPKPEWFAKLERDCAGDATGAAHA